MSFWIRVMGPMSKSRLCRVSPVPGLGWVCAFQEESISPLPQAAPCHEWKLQPLLLGQERSVYK